MVTKNDITGDKLISRASTPAFEVGYEAIWGKKKQIVALLDGDIFCYRAGFSCEKEGEATEPLSIAIARIDSAIDVCLQEVGAVEFKLFLTGYNNFRKEVYPEYKANRTAAKPIYLQQLRQHLIDNRSAFVCEGMEADDLLAINQEENTVICTIDKDLKQVVGRHYNFVKKEFVDVDELQGLRTYYAQFLIGDTVDNIIGIAGLGPAKSSKLMNSCINEAEMFVKIRELYNDDTRMRMNGICLWMKRTLDDDWGVYFDTMVGSIDE